MALESISKNKELALTGFTNSEVFKPLKGILICMLPICEF